MNKKRFGFTLIELLIVVAIIAILAAIAIPNFLEAQVRSKVSRAKTDMRSFAVALEAYRTDQNGYPTFHYTDYTYRSDPLGTGPGSVREWFVGGLYAVICNDTGSPFTGPYQITTPITYITSLPPDPFHQAEGDDPYDTRSFMYVNWVYAKEQNPGVVDDVFRMYGDWRLSSAGPDKSRHDAFHLLYDPTNGTVSLGQIHRTQRSPEGIPIDPW